MALIARQPAPGLVHHSDRGAVRSQDYIGMLKQHRATSSMSRKANPRYDNAACESFMKTLKHEEVYRNEYRDFHDAHASIGEFLERVYNQKRLHSARVCSASRVREGRHVMSNAYNTWAGSAPATPDERRCARMALLSRLSAAPAESGRRGWRSGRIPASLRLPSGASRVDQPQPRRQCFCIQRRQPFNLVVAPQGF